MMRPPLVTPYVLSASLLAGLAGCASFWPRPEAASEAIAASIGTPAESGWTDTTQESASTPAQRQVLRQGRIKTLTGEVVDVSCYLQLGKRGEAHIPCGQKCVRNGQPIGLLTDSGKLYLVIPEEHHARRDGTVSIRERFAELMAKRVRITGMVARDGDNRAIFVRSLPAETR